MDMTRLPEWNTYRFQQLSFATQSYLYGKPFYGASVPTLSDDIDLKEIERRALTAYHEDGLLDIFMGGFLLFIGLMAFIQLEHLNILVSFLPGLGALLYYEVKKLVTYPRIGYMKFTHERRARVARNSIIVIVVTGFVTLTGLFTGMGAPESAPWGVLLLNKYNLLFQGGVLAFIFLTLGRIMGVSRLYRYSVLSLLVFPAGYLYLDSPYMVTLQNMGTQCAIIGVVMVGYGALHLRRFIVRYPKEA